MHDQEYIVGKCSQCGEELRVPTRLESFSCMFCGAKLTPADLKDDMPEPVPVVDAPELIKSVEERILHCVAGYKEMYRKVNRKDYHPTFDMYEKGCRGIFEDLDLACRAEPENCTKWLEQVVASFLDQMEQRWKSAVGKKLARDEDKMTIAVFLVPMIDHLQLSIGREFCEILQKRWVERNPKAPFYIGSYENITSGFNKKLFGLCFITTAVCEELGKPDDCEELTAFRAFRDGYLMSCEDGPALVEEYYNIAPGIVTCINVCDNRSERYRAIREEYLAPCYADIQAGRMQECKDRYVKMVRDLEKQYLS